MPSILIKDGYLLDPILSFEQRDILIQDDLINQVAPNIDFRADRIIDASDKVIMPGLISAHTHTFNTPLRGLTENLPLHPWLLSINSAYAVLPKSPRDLYLWNAIGACGLLRSGTTSLMENGRGYQGYLPGIDYETDLDTTAKAFTDVGIRATICPMYADLRPSESLPLHLLNDIRSEDIVSMDTFPPPKTDDLIHMLHSLLMRWQKCRDSLVSLCLGPIQPYMCSRRLLEETVELASEFDVAIHTHLLESKPEVLLSTKMFSQPVIEF
ncbi:amidohydrolase family protein, partial [Chloroflexota bacterium]